jgi:hypothetical protein
MPITGSKRLEPSREKKTTREDKRHEIKKPRGAAPARPGASAIKRPRGKTSGMK